MEAQRVVEVFSALLAPVTAIVVVYIAYQQYRLSKLNTRRELYDRRLKVFRSTMQFISSVVMAAAVDVQRQQRFLYETAEADFLFGPEVRKYIHEVYRKGNEFRLAEHKMSGSRAADNQAAQKAADDWERLTNWFAEQFDEARSLFKKYLSLGDFL
jgi:hypothetical protein